MNPKNTWMLVVLAGGLFAFIYFFERHIQPPVPVAARILPALDPEEVSSIEIQPRGQFAIRVERVNGGWQLTKPIIYPVHGAAIDAFLKALVDLSPQRRISAEELQNDKKVNQEFGFDSPQATILIQQDDDQRRLELGNPTPPGDGIYAQVVGTEGIDIIGAGFAGYVPTNAGQWRDTSFVSLQGLPYVELDVASATGQLKFQRDDLDKPWGMVLPIRARAYNEHINGLLDKLQSLNVSQFKTDDTNADLEPFGLQSPPLVLTFKDKNTNQLLSVQFGKSPPDDASLVYARTNSSGTVVLVPREDLIPWSDDSRSFRDPHLFSYTISDQPGSIECYGPDGRTNFIVRSTNGVMMVSDGQGQAYPAETNSVILCLRNLAEMRVVPWTADRFADDAVGEPELPGMGLAPNPLRRYVLRAPPAGGAVRVIAQVDFGSPNTNQAGTVCARRSDLPAESSVFAVSSADLDRLPTSAVQLRLHRIWDFEATNVTSITIKANGDSHEWLQRKKYLWQPTPIGITDEAKGMIMDNLVENLGILEAAAWVGPGEPTEAYGFNANSTTITVTYAKGGRSRTDAVTFGGLVSGSNGARYACTTLDGQNWIFIMSAKDMNDLVNYLPTDN